MSARRVAGIAGLAYVAGVSIENMEVLGSPTLSSSVAEIRAAYADHAFAVVTSTAGALALLAYTAFVAALYVVVGPVEPWRTIMLAGGIGGPVVAAAGLAADAVLVGGGADVSDDVAAALYDLYVLARIVSGVFVALFMGGLGIAALRSGALPRPLPEAALAIAVPMALAPIAAFEQRRGLELAVTIAFAAQTLWIFCAGMWLTNADGVGPLAFLRRCAFLLLVIAAGLLGLGLLAAPGATGQFFAWSLKPEPLAAFAGGVYVGSAVAYALALGGSAREVRGLVAGAVVLSVSVLTITLVYTEQFDFSRLQAIIWVILFVTFSVVTAALFVLERPPDEGPRERLPAASRAIFATVAVVAGILALWLWIDPGSLAGPWPFDLPPLGGRFAGSWIALLAVVCGWAAVRDRADEARYPAILLISLPAGALIAGLRTIDQLEPAGGYLAAFALLTLAGAATLRRARLAG